MTIVSVMGLLPIIKNDETVNRGKRSHKNSADSCSVSNVLVEDDSKKRLGSKTVHLFSVKMYDCTTK